MNDEVDKYIRRRVSEYTIETYGLLDKIKVLIFNNLNKGVSIKETTEQIEEILNNYDDITYKGLDKDYRSLNKILNDIFIENEITTSSVTQIKPNKNELEGLKFKIDTTSTKKAKNKYIKSIEQFYKTTNKTLKKDYIDKISYLTKKVEEYNEVEKIVPYYYKNGKVRAHFDIAGYNSMVYNTNLTSSAWNTTIDWCGKKENNLVYVPAHPYSCPLCQEWQGRVFALTNTTPIYPTINDAIEGGLKHPNCKHPILPYTGQKETREYSTPEWQEKYEARQKKQSLELKRSRLKTDAKIYKEIGNMEEVDKIKQKVSNLNKKIKEQKELMG